MSRCSPAWVICFNITWCYNLSKGCSGCLKEWSICILSCHISVTIFIDYLWIIFTILFRNTDLLTWLMTLLLSMFTSAASILARSLHRWQNECLPLMMYFCCPFQKTQALKIKCMPSWRKCWTIFSIVKAYTFVCCRVIYL